MMRGRIHTPAAMQEARTATFSVDISARGGAKRDYLAM